MAVEFKYITVMNQFKERLERSIWIANKIPSQEYNIETKPLYDVEGDDGVDLDDEIETTVIIWHDDAEKIATEFWFKFP